MRTCGTAPQGIPSAGPALSPSLVTRRLPAPSHWSGYKHCPDQDGKRLRMLSDLCAAPGLHPLSKPPLFFSLWGHEG